MSCTCEPKTNQEVLEKVIAKGVANEKMPISYEIQCECGEKILMDTYLKQCFNCKAQFVVTPCKADNSENIRVILNEK